jgi:NAD(P)-dependent dehydrogenase (short-subunit alcohol dehydrogenase family)
MSTQNPSTTPVALITGASRGLGETLAHFLAGQGYDLVITARRADLLDETARALNQYGGKVVVVPGDVADADHRHKLGQAVQSLGRLDLLVNNASVLGPTPLPTMAAYPLDQLADVYAINVIAPLGLVQETLQLLKSSQGLVVNISSDAAVGGYPTWGGYGSSKAALDLVSLTLAKELGDEGVAVVNVDPGDMRTDMNQAANAGSDISGLPTPDVTLPFWAWLLGQDRTAVSGGRYQAQAERWEVPV